MEVIVKEGAEKVDHASHLTCIDVLSRKKSLMVKLTMLNLL
jgi:hypothetical protein